MFFSYITGFPKVVNSTATHKEITTKPTKRKEIVFIYTHSASKLLNKYDILST